MKTNLSQEIKHPWRFIFSMRIQIISNLKSSTLIPKVPALHTLYTKSLNKRCPRQPKTCDNIKGYRSIFAAAICSCYPLPFSLTFCTLPTCWLFAGVSEQEHRSVYWFNCSETSMPCSGCPECSMVNHGAPGYGTTGVKASTPLAEHEKWIRPNICLYPYLILCSSDKRWQRKFTLPVLLHWQGCAWWACSLWCRVSCNLVSWWFGGSVQ